MIKSFLNTGRNLYVDDGDHLIFILEVFPEEILTFEEVKQSVIKNYNNTLKEEAMKRYIYSVKNKYDVIIGEYR